MSNLFSSFDPTVRIIGIDLILNWSSTIIGAIICGTSCTEAVRTDVVSVTINLFPQNKDIFVTTDYKNCAAVCTTQLANNYKLDNFFWSNIVSSNLSYVNLIFSSCCPAKLSYSQAPGGIPKIRKSGVLFSLKVAEDLLIPVKTKADVLKDRNTVRKIILSLVYPDDIFYVDEFDLSKFN